MAHETCKRLARLLETEEARAIVPNGFERTARRDGNDRKSHAHRLEWNDAEVFSVGCVQQRYIHDNDEDGNENDDDEDDDDNDEDDNEKE